MSKRRHRLPIDDIPTIEEYVSALVAEHNRTHPISDEVRRQAVAILATIPRPPKTSPDRATAAPHGGQGEAPARQVERPHPLPAGSAQAAAP